MKVNRNIIFLAKASCFFVLFCTELSQAKILLPSFGNRTYASKGSNVTLDWSHSFATAYVIFTEWYFTRTGGTAEVLAEYLSGTLNTKPKISLPDISFKLPSTLILNNVNISYNGTYRLAMTVRGVNPSPESEVEVIILEQPVANVSCSSQLVVNEGGNISCVCSSIGGNPPATASWSRDEKEINGTGYLKKSLMLTNVSKNDTGVYKCMVKSHNLTNETSVDITVRYSPEGISFKVEGASGNYVDQNSNVTLKCQADTYPAATYSIFHDNTAKITNDSAGEYEYVINSMNSSHAGRYRCEAKNVLGTQTSNLTLVVKERPTANASCSPTKLGTVAEGENVKCVCTSIGGNPPPNASWYKDGKLISGPTNLINTLRLNNTNRNDNGTYLCKVESLNLFHEYNVTVVVRYPPEITSFTPNGSVTLTIGSSFNIICIAGGFPEPNVTLLYNGTILNQTVGKVEHKIDSVQVNNTGRYVCNATNDMGTTKESLRLTVKTVAPYTKSPSSLSSLPASTSPGTYPPPGTPTSNSVKKSGSCTEWYISLITLFCGILIGVIITCGIIYLRQRLTKRKQPPISTTTASGATSGPVYDEPAPRQDITPAGNTSTYQELNLQDMNRGDNYQALTGNAWNARSNEAVQENEGAYQELSKEREKVNDYQSLNRV